MKTLIASAALLLALSAPVTAKDGVTHYPRHQIGAGNGLSYATNPRLSTLGEIGLMGKHRTAMNLSFDYQYFFNRSWGITVEALFPNYSGENPEKWIPRVEGLGDEHFFADMSDEHWKTYSTYQCNITAGAVYRISKGPWSFQPSVGLGISLYNGNENISYYVCPPGEDHTQYVEMKFDGGASRQCMFSMRIDATVLRRLSKWFTIWLKPSFIINTGHIAGCITRTDDVTHELLETIHHSEKPGNYFNIQLGISLTINEVK